jgi:hypothetical protein
MSLVDSRGIASVGCKNNHSKKRVGAKAAESAPVTPGRRPGHGRCKKFAPQCRAAFAGNLKKRKEFHTRGAGELIGKITDWPEPDSRQYVPNNEAADGLFW